MGGGRIRRQRITIADHTTRTYLFDAGSILEVSTFYFAVGEDVSFYWNVNFTSVCSLYLYAHWYILCELNNFDKQQAKIYNSLNMKRANDHYGK